MDTPKCKFKTIDEYITKSPQEARDLMEQLRRVVREISPDAEETISYGIPTFKLKGKGLVSFGAWKNHIGFYPGTSAIAAFKKELAPYKQAKGTIQFPLKKPIPHNLVKRIVKFRIRAIQKTE
jgi:uncharacterized protein YdhG (YjbR/CyaY superfamily)